MTAVADNPIETLRLRAVAAHGMTLAHGNGFAQCVHPACIDARRALEDLETVVEALKAAREARRATDDWQRACIKQAHGFERDRCGECFLCLERKALVPFQVKS